MSKHLKKKNQSMTEENKEKDNNPALGIKFREPLRHLPSHFSTRISGCTPYIFSHSFMHFVQSGLVK